jgi:hypothetical protein
MSRSGLNLEAYKHISPDSGFPITIHPHFNPKITSHIPPDEPHVLQIPSKDRAFFAKDAIHHSSLLSKESGAKRIDLTESIGTVLEGVQISKLSGEQLDELASLVNERGVVFFREQDLDTEGQVRVFEQFGVLDKHPAQKVYYSLFSLSFGTLNFWLLEWD